MNTKTRRTVYTPAAKALLASLTPHAAMAALQYAQCVMQADGHPCNVPLSKLLTDEQRRARRRLTRSMRAPRQAAGVA